MSERLTLREIQAAGRNILKAPSPKRTAAAIRERMAAIDVVMAALTGPHYGTDFYAKLGAEWSRLSSMLDGVTGAAGGRGSCSAMGRAAWSSSLRATASRPTTRSRADTATVSAGRGYEADPPAEAGRAGGAGRLIHPGVPQPS